MKLADHLLFNDTGEQQPFVPSPNHGGTLQPEMLVIHFTAGRSAKNSVQWLASPAAKASAHLVIGEDGSITQMVPFNVLAWHAGKSAWKGRESVNRFSIGIELANPGNLRKTGSVWRTWFGDIVPDDKVLVATHKDRQEPEGWKIFEPEQIEAVISVSSLLVQTYSLREIVGHDDVSPGRKVDPGPAFPMERFRNRVLGRADV